jgi:hypothetical protein
MISISTVYNTLRALANEDQKGFVTPYTFNSMASLGQMNVYNEIVSGGFEASRFSNSRSDVRGGSSRLNSNKQHRSYYTKIVKLIPESNLETTYKLPMKMNKALSVSILNDTGLSEFFGGKDGLMIPIERDIEKFSMFSRAKASRGLPNTSVSGTSSVINNPNNAAFFIVDGNGILTKTSDDAAPDLAFTYLRYPGSVLESGKKVSNNPSLAIKGSGTSAIVDDSSSFNFDLPEAFLGDIVNEMAKLIGVQLEETMVYQYGSAEEIGNEKKQLN